MAESFLQAVDDIWECPICLETMNDTRVLPCIHTFCLKCIQQHGKDSKRDEKINCPCCRKTCLVPAGGFQEFPKNILLEKLLESRSSMKETSASIMPQLQCSNGQDNSSNNSSRMCRMPCHNGKVNSPTLANGYCVECESYVCSECWKKHTRQSETGSHLILPTGCTEHPEKSLEFYCKTCEMPICERCTPLKHRNHMYCALSDHVNSLDSEIKALKSKLFEKKALERENQALKAQIVNIEKTNNQTLKTQAVIMEKIKKENDTLKVRDVEMKQHKQENKTLKSRISFLENYEREIKICKAKHVPAEILINERKLENKALKSMISYVEKHESEIESPKAKVTLVENQRSDFASKIAELKRETDCRVLSYEPPILWRNENCSDSSFFWFIVVILLAALIYVFIW